MHRARRSDPHLMASAAGSLLRISWDSLQPWMFTIDVRGVLWVGCFTPPCRVVVMLSLRRGVWLVLDAGISGGLAACLRSMRRMARVSFHYGYRFRSSAVGQSAIFLLAISAIP